MVNWAQFVVVDSGYDSHRTARRAHYTTESWQRRAQPSVVLSARLIWFEPHRPTHQSRTVWKSSGVWPGGAAGRKPRIPAGLMP